MSREEEALEVLMVQAEVAHGSYEAVELGGVYDERWADWYAAYAVDHGIDRILGHAVKAGDLGRFLAGAFADFQAATAPAGEAWPAYMARRIAAEL